MWEERLGGEERESVTRRSRIYGDITQHPVNDEALARTRAYAATAVAAATTASFMALQSGVFFFARFSSSKARVLYCCWCRCPFCCYFVYFAEAVVLSCAHVYVYDGFLQRHRWNAFFYEMDA